LWDARFACEALNWKRNVQYAEIYGDRRASRWTIEEAQNRAKDEVLAALFLAQRAERIPKPLNEYLSSFKEKTVLILGSYDPAGEKRLRAIAAAVTEIGYEPILLKDIPNFEHYDISQKVVAIGAVMRFMVLPGFAWVRGRMASDSTPEGRRAPCETRSCTGNCWASSRRGR
jgi:hypothetical protein